MDNNSNYNPYNGIHPYGFPRNNFPSYQPTNKLEMTSLILGFCSVAICNCIYLSFPFGALAIIFALLSRGKKMELGSKAKIGLILGIAGLVITTAFYIYAFYIGIQEAGSFENLLRESCEMLGYDFDTLFGDMFQE